MKTLNEVLARMAEIQSEIDSEDADLDALAKEFEELKSERQKYIDKQEKRNAIANEVVNGKAEITVLSRTEKEEERKAVPNTEKLYRNAFIKNLMGVELNAEERAAFTHTTENTPAVIPTETANKIFSTLGEVHPIVGDVKRLNTKGIFRMIRHTEIVQGDAKQVAELAANDDEQNTFVEVVLAGKKISKHVRISYELKAMAVDEFENYLVAEIGQRIEAELARLIIASIKDETKGIVAANKLSAATAGTLTVSDVLRTLAALKDVGTTYIYANRADVFGSIASMENTNQTLNFLPDLQNKVSGNLLGNGIKQEDALAPGEILVLDPYQFLLNIASPLEIIRQREATTGDWVIAGHVLADGAMENPKAGAVLTVGEDAGGA